MAASLATGDFATSDPETGLPYETWPPTRQAKLTLAKACAASPFLLAVGVQQVGEEGVTWPCTVAATTQALFIFHDEDQGPRPARWVPFSRLRAAVSNTQRRGFFPSPSGALLADIPPESPFCSLVLENQAVEGKSDSVRLSGEGDDELDTKEDKASAKENSGQQSLVVPKYDLCFVGPLAAELAAGIRTILASVRLARLRIGEPVGPIEQVVWRLRRPVESAAVAGLANFRLPPVPAGPGRAHPTTEEKRTDLATHRSVAEYSFAKLGRKPLWSRELEDKANNSARMLALAEHETGAFGADCRMFPPMSVTPANTLHPAGSNAATLGESSAAVGQPQALTAIAPLQPAPPQYLAVDPTTQLRYVDVPAEFRPMFPHLVASAVLWFGLVAHWAPPDDPMHAFAFVTPTHLHVVESDGTATRRCVPLVDISALNLPKHSELSLGQPPKRSVLGRALGLAPPPAKQTIGTAAGSNPTGSAERAREEELYGPGGRDAARERKKGEDAEAGLEGPDADFFDNGNVGPAPIDEEQEPYRTGAAVNDGGKVVDYCKFAALVRMHSQADDHDVFLGFAQGEQLRRFAKAITTILQTAYEQTVKTDVCPTLQQVPHRLSPRDDLATPFVVKTARPPPRAISAIAAVPPSVVRTAKDAEAKHSADVAAYGLAGDISHSSAQGQQSPPAPDAGATPPPAVAAPAAATAPGAAGVAPVVGLGGLQCMGIADPSLSDDVPELLGAAVLWVGRVLDLTDSAAAPHGAPKARAVDGTAGAELHNVSHSGDNCIAILTNTHFYVATVGRAGAGMKKAKGGTKFKRCIPVIACRKALLKQLERLDLVIETEVPKTEPEPKARGSFFSGSEKTAKAKTKMVKKTQQVSVPPRSFVLLSNNDPEYDLLLQTERPGDGAMLVSMLLKTIKAWAPDHDVEVGSFDSPSAEGARLAKPQDAQPPFAPALPKRIGPATLKARLEHFFECHDPTGLAGVEKMLTQFRGFEEEMFRQLVARYGPEPVAVPTEPSAATSRRVVARSWEERLERFYAHYEPRLTKDAEAIIHAHRGNEVALIASLVAQYGPEPAPRDLEEQQAEYDRKRRAEAQSAADSVSSDLLFAPPTAEPERHPIPLTVNEAPGVVPVLEQQRNLFDADAPLPEKRIGLPALDIAVRVTRMLDTYAPERVGTAKRLLAQNAGRERQLLRSLVDRYGPEPFFSLPAAKMRLRSMLLKYDPDRLGEVKKMLRSYEGREEEMFEALTERYGPEPHPMAFDERLRRYYANNNPGKMSQVPILVKKYAGMEHKAFEKMRELYGDEPESHKQLYAKEELEGRLARFYRRYCPEKLPDAKDLAKRYEEQAVAVFQRLVAKYGPEPPLYDDLPPSLAEQANRQTLGLGTNTPSATATPEDEGNLTALLRSRMRSAIDNRFDEDPWNDDFKEPGRGPVGTVEPAPEFIARLRRFFAVYNPSKVATVETLARRFPTLEDELMHRLAMKYGPEPDPESPAVHNAMRQAAIDMDTHRIRLRDTSEIGLAIIKEDERPKVAPEDATFVAPDGTLQKMSPVIKGPRARLIADLMRFLKRYTPQGHGVDEEVVTALVDAYVGREAQLKLWMRERGAEVSLLHELAAAAEAQSTLRAEAERAKEASPRRLSYYDLEDAKAGVARRLSSNSLKSQDPPIDGSAALPGGTLRLSDTVDDGKPRDGLNSPSLVQLHDVPDGSFDPLHSKPQSAAASVAASGVAAPSVAESVHGSVQGTPANASIRSALVPPEQQFSDEPAAAPSAAGSAVNPVREPSDAMFDHNDVTPPAALQPQGSMESFITPSARAAAHNGRTPRYPVMPFAQPSRADLANFPALHDAALYYFETAGHYAPPQEVQHRKVFMSRTHLYVAESEFSVLRCLPMEAVLSIYMTTNRLVPTTPCLVLIKVHPSIEHDLLLSFPDNKAAQHFAFTLIFAIKTFVTGRKVAALPVVTFSEAEVATECVAPRGFKPKIAPIPRRAHDELLRETMRSQTASHIGSPRTADPFFSEAELQSMSPQHRASLTNAKGEPLTATQRAVVAAVRAGAMAPLGLFGTLDRHRSAPIPSNANIELPPVRDPFDESDIEHRRQGSLAAADENQDGDENDQSASKLHRSSVLSQGAVQDYGAPDFPTMDIDDPEFVKLREMRDAQEKAAAVTDRYLLLGTAPGIRTGFPRGRPAQTPSATEALFGDEAYAAARADMPLPGAGLRSIGSASNIVPPSISLSHRYVDAPPSVPVFDESPITVTHDGVAQNRKGFEGDPRFGRDAVPLNATGYLDPLRANAYRPPTARHSDGTALSRVGSNSSLRSTNPLAAFGARPDDRGGIRHLPPSVPTAEEDGSGHRRTTTQWQPRHFKPSIMTPQIPTDGDPLMVPTGLRPKPAMDTAPEPSFVPSNPLDDLPFGFGSTAGRADTHTDEFGPLRSVASARAPNDLLGPFSKNPAAPVAAVRDSESEKRSKEFSMPWLEDTTKGRQVPRVYHSPFSPNGRVAAGVAKPIVDPNHAHEFDIRDTGEMRVAQSKRIEAEVQAAIRLLDDVPPTAVRPPIPFEGSDTDSESGGESERSPEPANNGFEESNNGVDALVVGVAVASGRGAHFDEDDFAPAEAAAPKLPTTAPEGADHSPIPRVPPLPQPQEPLVRSSSDPYYAAAAPISTPPIPVEEASQGPGGRDGQTVSLRPTAVSHSSDRETQPDGEPEVDEAAVHSPVAVQQQLSLLREAAEESAKSAAAQALLSEGGFKQRQGQEHHEALAGFTVSPARGTGTMPLDASRAVRAAGGVPVSGDVTVGALEPLASAMADAVGAKLLESYTVDDIKGVLEELGLAEHLGRFRRTDGLLLMQLTKEDIRRRVSGDEEAADVFWLWTAKKIMQQRDARLRSSHRR